MKHILFALLLPVTAPAAPLDWRDVSPQNPFGRLMTTLHRLAAETPEPMAVPMLLESLPAFAKPMLELPRAFVARLTVAERTRLRTRIPAMIETLAGDEPYLGLALARARRTRDPAEAKRPLRMIVRDYYRIAMAKLRGRKFVIADREMASTTAEALLRLETFVDLHAHEVQVEMTATDEMLELLGNLPELGERLEPTARFVAQLLDDVDWNELPRLYRQTYSLSGRVEIGARLETLLTALDSREASSVVKTRNRMRGRNPALATEHELKIKLKGEGTKALGGLLGRYAKHLDKNLAEARVIEMRAHRLLRLEEIVRGATEPSCGENLEELARRAAPPIRR